MDATRRLNSSTRSLPMRMRLLATSPPADDLRTEADDALELFTPRLIERLRRARDVHLLRIWREREEVRSEPDDAVDLTLAPHALGRLTLSLGDARFDDRLRGAVKLRASRDEL